MTLKEARQAGALVGGLFGGFFALWLWVEGGGVWVSGIVFMILFSICYDGMMKSWRRERDDLIRDGQWFAFNSYDCCPCGACQNDDMGCDDPPGGRDREDLNGGADDTDRAPAHAQENKDLADGARGDRRSGDAQRAARSRCRRGSRRLRRGRVSGARTRLDL